MLRGRSALAANLKRIRDDLDLSQKVLAKKAGISWRSIQNAEIGQSGMDADSLVALSDFLGLPVDSLVREGAYVPPPSPTVEKLLELTAQQEQRIHELEARLAPAPRVEDADAIQLATKIARLIVERCPKLLEPFRATLEEFDHARAAWERAQENQEKA